MTSDIVSEPKPGQVYCSNQHTMNNFVFFYFSLVLLVIFYTEVQALTLNCSQVIDHYNSRRSDWDFLLASKTVVPTLVGKRKGENGKIGVVGGSLEYSGAPYFAAITALKIGADLVFVITTQDASPVIKSYSPELIVHPTFNVKSKTLLVLQKLDTVVIGPGLGRDEETLSLFYDLVDTCRLLKKPLVLDADALFAISKNVSVLVNYPGAIMTPNHAEAKHLQEAVQKQGYKGNWYEYWGHDVTVLEKGKTDRFYSHIDLLNWNISEGGSDRRAGGQGDVLAGALGTFYNWALNSNICEGKESGPIKQSIASYAAAIFTRKCSERAFLTHGRSMTASDMLVMIHTAFSELFEKRI